MLLKREPYYSIIPYWNSILDLPAYAEKNSNNMETYNSYWHVDQEQAKKKLQSSAHFQESKSHFIYWDLFLMKLA